MEPTAKDTKHEKRPATKDVVVPTTMHVSLDDDAAPAFSGTQEAENGKKVQRKSEAELIGEAVKPTKIPEAAKEAGFVEESSEELLGRPHVNEKNFTTDVKVDRKRIDTPEMRFAELQRLATAYLNPDDVDMLEKAFLFARDAHAGQCRKSGEPFIAHPVEVALILADLRMDVETLCAALLHDTVEDSDVSLAVVEEQFNQQVAQLVDGVTKITRIEVESLSD